MSHPEHPLIDVWSAVKDTSIPDDVLERLIDRQAAVRQGRTPDEVSEGDKPYLARHIVPEPGEEENPTEDDGPACWVQAPGGGVRCGLEVDHDGEHRYTIWTPLETEENHG